MWASCALPCKLAWMWIRRTQGRASGATALIATCVDGHEAVTRLLLVAGAVVDRKEDTNGWTALMMASRHGHEGAVRLLLEVGAVVDSKDTDGQTG